MFSRIKWKNEYNTGIEIIDTQHKKLFEIAETAYDLLSNDLILDKYDKIVQIIEDLKEYTIFHDEIARTHATSVV